MKRYVIPVLLALVCITTVAHSNTDATVSDSTHIEPTSCAHFDESSTHDASALAELEPCEWQAIRFFMRCIALANREDSRDILGTCYELLVQQLLRCIMSENETVILQSSSLPAASCGCEDRSIGTTTS